MQAIGYLILLGWAAFWIYWIVAAAGAKTQRPQAGTPAGILVRFGIVLVVLVLLRTRAFADAGLIRNLLVQGVGIALFVLGLGLAVWARLYIGRNWGMPMSVKVDPELVTTGPYRYIRHPIYSGVILAMVGTALAVGLIWLLIAGALAAYFVYSATVEERNLERLFPATYPAYKRSTKMLIPFIF